MVKAKTYLLMGITLSVSIYMGFPKELDSTIGQMVTPTAVNLRKQRSTVMEFGKSQRLTPIQTTTKVSILKIRNMVKGSLYGQQVGITLEDMFMT